MALLLNIDTATEQASVCLSEDKLVLELKANNAQKEHASFVHKAISEILYNAGKALKDIDAYSVTSGPGSYTGLRVGLATVKGFCYTMSKPLITISTLKVMALAAQEFMKPETNILFCPMIDARRTEVFMAVYNSNLEELMKPQPVILNEELLKDKLENHKIIFSGNGSFKFKPMISHSNACFMNVGADASHLAALAAISLNNQDFASTAYAEPDYCKNFYKS